MAVPGRDAVIADPSRHGGDLCRALSRATDEWLVQQFESARAEVGGRGRVAFLAVGGYGRGELAPFSDLDLLLLHDGKAPVEALAAALWYPIWDEGLKLGHAVRQIKDALQLADNDLEVATSLVTGRLLAGDAGLAEELLQKVVAAWRKRGEARLVELEQHVRRRHEEHGEVAFLLEPNLKEGRGGLRDIHALRWAAEAGLSLAPQDIVILARDHELLTLVRAELHRVTGRANEVLRLEDQDAVALAAGFSDADAMMAALASTARSVAWVADDVWARLHRQGLDGRRASAQPARAVDNGVHLEGGEIHLDQSADPAVDPTLVLRVATASARHDAHIDRESLTRLGRSAARMPNPWPPGARDDLVALLLEGHRAIPALESLDQMNLMVRVLPEWEPVRSRPQRNAYHRFTVDRHLWETAANAADLTDRVARPDLLVLGALLHDLGKGYPGDHTDAGVKLVRRLAPRLGLSTEDTKVVELMVRHHLLLADVATRRDLSDDATIVGVAEAVGSPLVLDLLHALTIADSHATGPAAWGSWKAGLVEELVERVHHVLGGGDVRELGWRLFPSAEVLALMGERRVAVVPGDDRVTVVSPDLPGTFSRVAGVLTLHGLSVLGAEAHSDAQGMAASEFTVQPQEGRPVSWDPVVADLHRALAGQLALEARLAEKAKVYRRRRAQSAAAPATRLLFDDRPTDSTVIEVHAPDRVGVLYRITKALADVGLDIRHARVQTLGDGVVDAFYVRTQDGGPLRDEFHRAEVERAVLHAVHSPG